MANEISLNNLPNIITELCERVEKLEAEKKGKSQSVNLLNGTELCKAIGISELTLIRWRKAGKIPFIEVNGGYRYSLEDVIEAATKKPKK